MVGSPKDLSQLRKIDAHLRVTCRACGKAVQHDPRVLIGTLIGRGGNLTWSELPRQLPCPACGSADVKVAPVPFAGRATRDRPNKHQRLITLALAVLDAAAYASRSRAVAEAPVQLALRVLLPYVAERQALVTYWEIAQAPADHPWEGCREAYYGIAKALRDAGWHAPV